MSCNCCIDNIISRICQNEYEIFFSKANVVGVGLGYKVKNGFCTCQKCIAVFVKRKFSSNGIPTQDLIPSIYKGILTDVVEIGVISMNYHNKCNFIKNSLKERKRPVLGGYSIGVATLRNAGSMGCLVTDNHDNFILSCNHVLANNNRVSLGTAIVQPSVLDGGKSPKDIVAGLSEYVPIKFNDINITDCAIARVMNKNNVLPKIDLVNGPKGVSEPELGEDVKKVGKSTQLTKGKIKYIYSTIKLEIEKKDVTFKNQIITSPMSETGDSGAVLLNEYNYAVGLLMSGGPGASIFNTMSDVLKSLDVLLVTV